jgi:hypothetical protein
MCCRAVSKDVDICARRWLLCTCSVCDGAVAHFFKKMACFEYVSVVDTGTAAGAREGE